MIDILLITLSVKKSAYVSSFNARTLPVEASNFAGEYALLGISNWFTVNHPANFGGLLPPEIPGARLNAGRRKGIVPICTFLIYFYRSEHIDGISTPTTQNKGK
jgi:hypothetical protein